MTGDATPHGLVEQGQFISASRLAHDEVGSRTFEKSANGAVRIGDGVSSPGEAVRHGDRVLGDVEAEAVRRLVLQKSHADAIL